MCSKIFVYIVVLQCKNVKEPKKIGAGVLEEDMEEVDIHSSNSREIKREPPKKSLSKYTTGDGKTPHTQILKNQQFTIN